MCGPSASQNQIEATQSAFYSQLTQEYDTIFGQDQSVLAALTKSFEPVLAAGPNQEGFSGAEKTALESEATTGVGENYANAQKALAVQQGTEGGGNAYIPSGAKEEQRAQLAESAAQVQSGEQLGIEQADYAQGLQDYQFAANELGGVASQLNPAGFANSATGAGGAAASTANQIAQANDSWMNLVGGGLGAAATAYAGR